MTDETNRHLRQDGLTVAHLEIKSLTVGHLAQALGGSAPAQGQSVGAPAVSTPVAGNAPAPATTGQKP